MKSLLPICLAAVAVTACGGASREVLPISRNALGSARLGAVDIYMPGADASIQYAGNRVTVVSVTPDRLSDPPTSEAYAAIASDDPGSLLDEAMQQAASRWGLTGEMKIRIHVLLDHYAVARPGSAFLGEHDRLAGSVVISELDTDRALGQLYVDVDRVNPGILGLVTRGTNVEEALAREFASRVMRAISGRRAPHR